MSKYVVDTNILIRFMNGIKSMNDKIQDIMEKADQGEHTIIIPSIVLFEIAYLNEKGRIPITLDYVSILIENSVNYLVSKKGVTMSEFLLSGFLTNQ